MRTESLYEYIVLAHYLNFTTAAANLHITQPNLSKHISEIEQEVGVELIKRGKSLQLTAAGAAFLEDSIQMHNLYKRALIRCNDIADQATEELVIQEPYVIDTMSEILYKAVARFKAEHPYTRVRLTTEKGRKSVESLESGKLDVALTIDCNSMDWMTKVSEKKGLIFVPVVREPLCVWLADDHPLLKLDNITLEDLAEVPINMTTMRDFDPMRFAVLDLFATIGVKPDLQTRSFDTLNEFFMNTQDRSAVFLVSPVVAQSPLLCSQHGMTHVRLADERARITSYLILKDDYRKKSIDLLLDTIEHVVANDVEHPTDYAFLDDIAAPASKAKTRE